MLASRNEWMCREPTARVFRRALLPVLAAGIALALAGCTTRVVNTSSQIPAASAASSAMPRPRQVYVVDFTTDHASLQLDQGIGPRLQRALQGSDPSAAQQQMLQDVQDSIADALVANVQQMGLAAERVAGPPPAYGPAIVVRGQILRINQGNRTRRLGIGFGAGMSDVSAQVQVSYERPGAAGQVVQTYDADSNSGHKPGLALGAASVAGGGSVAPAVLSGAAGVNAERSKTEVAKEGEKLGNKVAYNLGQYFAQQGWIPQSAVPTPSLR